MLRWDADENEAFPKSSSLRRAGSAPYKSSPLGSSSSSARSSGSGGGGTDFGSSPPGSRRTSTESGPGSAPGSYKVREGLHFDGWSHFVDTGHLNNPATNEIDTGKRERPFLAQTSSGTLIGLPGTTVSEASPASRVTTTHSLGLTTVSSLKSHGTVSHAPDIPPVIAEGAEDDVWDPFKH